jgi:hypothetical protein
MRARLSLIMMLTTLLVVLCACTNSGPQVPQNANSNNDENTLSESGPGVQTEFQYITNPKKSSHNTYNIYMPGEWSETSINGAIVYLPEESELLDVYSEKIAIAVTLLAEDDHRGIDSLIADNEAQMKGMVKELNFNSRENFRLGPLDGKIVKGNYSITGQMIEFTKVSALQDNRFYRFEITCKQNPCKYLDIFYEMANSFEPKNLG